MNLFPTFRPRLLPTLAMLVVVVIALGLGRWQSERAAEKMATQVLLEERIKAAILKLDASARDADKLRYRRVQSRGLYLEQQQIFLDNKEYAGHTGYHVITPLLLAGTQTSVLINRGWIERARTYPVPPLVPVPAGEVEVTGLAVLPPARFVELSQVNVEGRVWQNLTIDRVRAKLGIDVLPVVVLADPVTPGLAAVTEAPDTGMDKHRIYAFQWFSLAAVALVFWLVVNLRRGGDES